MYDSLDYFKEKVYSHKITYMRIYEYKIIWGVTYLLYHRILKNTTDFYKFLHILMVMHLTHYLAKSVKIPPREWFPFQLKTEKP